MRLLSRGITSFVLYFSSIMIFLDNFWYYDGLKFFFFTDFYTYCRFTGTIVEIGDADSNLWPESKWRCLKVMYLYLLVACVIFVRIH